MLNPRKLFSDLTVLITAGTIIAGLAVSAVLGHLDSERNRSLERVSVLSELSTHRANLEGIIASTFNITQGMVYIISHQGNISKDLFDAITSRAMADNPHIRNIALAPGNVVSMVYPYKGNEKVIGLNYQNVAEQWATVSSAMEQRRPLLSGPVELVQGGMALIERSPVYIQNSNDSTETYWGMVSIVAHINSIISQANLQSSSNLSFLVLGKDGKGIDGAPIWGDTAIIDMEPVFLDVTIPGGKWALMAVPKNGWMKNAPFKSLYFLIGLTNTLLISIFLVILIHRNRSIKTKNRELKIAITERDAISEALSISEVKYRNLIEEMRDVVVIINQDGFITYCSPSIHSFGGYLVEEVEGSFWRNFIVDSIHSITKMEIADTMPLAKYERLELVFIPKNRDPFYIDVAIRSIRGEADRVHYHCVLRDIHERKQLEFELTKSKEEAESANRMKSSFLANMSHEVRTPMNAILGFSDILMKSRFEENESRQYLEVIHNSSQQLLNLINDIIDISLIESGQLKITPGFFKIKRVFHMVIAVHKMSALQKGIDLVLDQQGNGDYDAEIYSDESRIIQVLSNLVGNAIKFTHSGSVVIGFELNPSMLRFYVRDTGIGIPPESLDVIFERFRQVDERYSRKYGGTGLGLSICKSIVEMMGGKMYVESEVNKGSVFTFEIPVVKP